MMNLVEVQIAKLIEGIMEDERIITEARVEADRYVGDVFKKPHLQKIQIHTESLERKMKLLGLLKK